MLCTGLWRLPGTDTDIEGLTGTPDPEWHGETQAAMGLLKPGSPLTLALLPGRNCCPEWLSLALRAGPGRGGLAHPVSQATWNYTRLVRPACPVLQ